MVRAVMGAVGASGAVKFAGVNVPWVVILLVFLAAGAIVFLSARFVLKGDSRTTPSGLPAARRARRTSSRQRRALPEQRRDRRGGTDDRAVRRQPRTVRTGVDACD